MVEIYISWISKHLFDVPRGTSSIYIWSCRPQVYLSDLSIDDAILENKRVLPEASFLEECHPDILPDNLPDFLSRKFAQNYVPSLYIVLNLPETPFHCSRDGKLTNFCSSKKAKLIWKSRILCNFSINDWVSAKNTKKTKKKLFYSLLVTFSSWHARHSIGEHG